MSDRDPFEQHREVASRMARADLARLKDVPHSEDGFVPDTWLVDLKRIHRRWSHKPRVRVLVSMKTGKCSLATISIDDYLATSMEGARRQMRYLHDRAANQYGVAYGQPRH